MATLQEIMDELQARLDPEKRRISRLAGTRHLELVPQITCTDGLKLSVQAQAFAYCSPRDNYGPWHSVEVGFPSRLVPEILEWAEDAERPTDTVYGYVPLAVVAAAILAAGGFAK